jgi:hypothetical protein
MLAPNIDKPFDSWQVGKVNINVKIRPNFKEKFYFTEFILKFVMPHIPHRLIYVVFRVLERLFVSTIVSIESFKTSGFRDATDEERKRFGFPLQDIQAFYTLNQERKEFTIWLRIPRLSISTVPVSTHSEIHFSLKEDQIRLLLEGLRNLKDQDYKEDKRGINSIDNYV